MRAGETKKILCPYCGELNRKSNEFLCCELFQDACNAVVDRMDKQDAIDFMNKTHDNANRRIN